MLSKGVVGNIFINQDSVESRNIVFYKGYEVSMMYSTDSFNLSQEFMSP